ncbi:hypothetical protein PROP_01924 [Propionicimonas sp. T2.31MG-18]|uniref:SURF1 family protein n=1 Tax=Propionicimonas sp. T2.31MG-18 TaxID=3157620 RepID=UPI0035EF0775
MVTRAKQWLVAVLGAALCLAMLALGLWQMRVFEDKEAESAAARAAQPPVPLLANVGADGITGDVYGRAVSLEGRYEPGQQALVVDEDGTVRVVTAFVTDDGRALAVVRGTVPDAASALPSPPEGRLTQAGVFLPSEAPATHATPPGTLSSVRLPLLAQDWPQQLFPGYVTLGPGDAAAQGLGAAPVRLPTGEGSVQNIGYALQWWAFAAFGAFMTIRFVRAIGRRGGLGTLADQEDE